MRLLLVGAAGQVGAALLPELATLGDVVATTRGGGRVESADAEAEAVDVTDADAIRGVVRRVRPDVVINATAYTGVDRAETEPELAYRVNHAAPGVLADACSQFGARLVHYSTDYVFDGEANSPYDIDHPTAPTGVYGASKSAGEQAVRAALPDALILRTAWVYGLHGHNFLRTMLRLAKEREELRVVADQVGCPTPSWLIASATANLLRLSPAPGGTYHLVTRGSTSWHGFAEAIMDEACARGLLERRPVVRAIPTSQYPTPARRPPWSVLDPSRLEAVLGRRFPAWDVALAQTFERRVQTPEDAMR